MLTLGGNTSTQTQAAVDAANVRYNYSNQSGSDLHSLAKDMEEMDIESSIAFGSNSSQVTVVDNRKNLETSVSDILAADLRGLALERAVVSASEQVEPGPVEMESQIRTIEEMGNESVRKMNC